MKKPSQAQKRGSKNAAISQVKAPQTPYRSIVFTDQQEVLNGGIDFTREEWSCIEAGAAASKCTVAQFITNAVEKEIQARKEQGNQAVREFILEAWEASNPILPILKGAALKDCIRSAFPGLSFTDAELDARIQETEHGHHQRTRAELNKLRLKDAEAKIYVARCQVEFLSLSIEAMMRRWVHEGGLPTPEKFNDIEYGLCNFWNILSDSLQSAEEQIALERKQ